MNMIILIHVLIAVSSVVAATVLALSPSRTKLRVSATLIALTLISGTYLVISLRTPLLHACLEGLAYLGVAMTGVTIGYRRLAHETEPIE